MRDGSKRRRAVLKGQHSSLLAGGIMHRAVLMPPQERDRYDAHFLGRSHGEGKCEKKRPFK